MQNELLVGAIAISKRFKVSRARLLYWETLGAPIYRRGGHDNAPLCADYHKLLAWEEGMALARKGHMDGPAPLSSEVVVQ